MAKILILFAHPALEKSRVHSRLIRHLQGHPDITFHDLYEEYPDFDIDIKREQQLLLKHDIIIWQHPFYWYSAPAIIKQWLDLVLEHDWAYGSRGNQLTGKWGMNAITCGGPRSVYQREGRNRFTINEFLAPFNQTCHLCKMKYLPPFVIDGTHRLQENDIDLMATQYEQLLMALCGNKITEAEWKEVEFLNDLSPLSPIIQS
jgi:glutathione-regulated potassium-efflux system ancillary protein KefG